MFESQKHVFWEALILAIFIFASGILLGYFLELNRTSQIITAYQESEINLLDIQIQKSTFSEKIDPEECSFAIKEMMNFADRTYNEAKLLEKYEGSSKLSEGLLFQHKKYALLRAILWSNAIDIKSQCPSFDTVVYIYELEPKDVEVSARQNSFSKYLEELKQEKGNSILLIPLAGNTEASSIDFLKQRYNVQEFPSIIVNEKNLITTVSDLESIRNYLR